MACNCDLFFNLLRIPKGKNPLEDPPSR